MRKSLHLVLISIFWMMIALGSQAQSLAPNGCGSGWNTYLVPDSIPVLNCNFERSCNRHDTCYGKCIPGAPDSSIPACRYLECKSGGSLAGQSICTSKQFVQLAQEAASRRLTCDTNFYADLTRENSKNLACQTFALLYREMVMIFGAGSFLGAGADSELAAHPWSVPYDTEQAISEMLAHRSRDHLISTLQRLESARTSGSRLDLSKPIKYDRQRGLINRWQVE